jgi:polysaccharide chain length determinant protein (PEP-CTERM system associated)
MLPGQSLSPETVGRVLVRRRWLILLPFAMGLAATPLIAGRVPKVYRSETLIMVIPQRVPDSYVRSTVTASVEDRLPSISDQILSRTRLEGVIVEFDLYRELRARAPMEDVVARMRRDIGPVQIQSGQQSFRVSYGSPQPETAQKVTARLASLFIEENSRDRENLAQSTNVFLESQLEEAKQRLLEHEERVEAYKLRYSGELPSQLSSNLQAMAASQIQLQALGESQNRARERRLLFERQLADAEASPLPSPVTPLPGTADTASALPAAQQLEAVEAKLMALRLRYTSDHPDVRTLERTARELRIKVDEEKRQPREAAPARMLPAEQVRQKRISELKAELEVIDHQLSASQAEETRLKAVIADYGQKVAAVPTRESQLVELTRDYEILKETYNSLLTKREDSKLAANLERLQIGEQFRILDPASLPERPDNRRLRLGFSLAGAIAGLLLGAGLAVLLEQRDSSFKNGEEVQRLLELPVLALVPQMSSASERRSRRRYRLLRDLAAGAVVACSVAAVAIWGLQNL